MPWKATVTGKSTQGGNVRAAVEFENSDTGEKILRDDWFAVDLSDERIARLSQTFIEQLELRDASHAALTVGKVKLPRDEAPTDEADAKQAAAEAHAFFALYRKQQAAEAALAAGVIKADDAELGAARAAVKAAFKAEYATDPRMKMG